MNKIQNQEKNISNFGFNKKSEPWQRMAKVGDKFVMRGNYEEVIWGKIISQEEFNNQLPLTIRDIILNNPEVLSADPKNIRMVQLNAGHMAAPIITIIPVALIEAFVPERVYQYAEKILWPINPHTFLNIMYPLLPINGDFKLLIN